MANRFLNSIKINDAYTFPASDGANGQAIITDGAGNLSFGDVASGGSGSASVIYRDNFVGDGVETQFYLQRSLTTEDQSQVFLNGVYQEKDTYTVVGNLLTFSTAPASGYSVEVMSITGINTGPTTLYQDNFTGNGSSTTFTLANSVNDEIKTMVFLNGVYQFKGTYSVSGTSLIFDAAPANGVAIEVITIASASTENSAQKVLFYGKATGAISKGDAVMFAGAQGDHFLIAKATQAALSANHEYILGLANQNFAVNEYGYVVEFGRVDAIDTSMYTAGDILWFDSEGTTAGAITNVQPTPPNTKIQLAAVIRSHANEGVLFVRPTIYHELSELHDVSITSIADKDLLSWNNTLGVWENTKSLGNITTTGLVVDTDTLYVDSVNNRVGVGVSDPNSKLHISGPLTFTEPGYSSVRRHSISNSHSDGSNVNNYLAFNISNGSGTTTEKMRINGAGDVGIGTSSPSAKLEVKGETSGFRVITSSSTSVTLSMLADLGLGYDNAAQIVAGQQSSNNGYIAFNTKTAGVGSEKMRIDSSGNVGIGTVSPTSYVSRFIEVSNATSAGIKLTSTSGLNSGVSMGYIASDKSFRITNYESTGVIRFETQDIERTRITSNGTVLVKATTSAYGEPLGYTFGVRGVSSQAYISIARGNQTLDSQGMILGLDTNSGYVWLRDNIDLSFGTNDTTKMVVKANGNVGIGTTSPINGKIEVKQTSNDATHDVKVQAVFGPSGYLDSDSPNLFGASLSETQFTNGATNRPAMLSLGGNLQVNEALGAINFFASNNDANYRSRANIYGGYINTGTAGKYGGDLSFSTAADGAMNPTRRMRITPAGDVGVGTDSPGAKFEVAGQIRSTAATGEIYAYSTAAANWATIYAGWTGGTGMMMRYHPDTAEGYIENNYPATVGQVYGDINFRQSVGGTMTTRMIIKADGGNVGIGRTNPSYRLDVYRNGAAGFRVQTIGSSYNSPSIAIGDASSGMEGIFTVASGGVEFGTYSNNDIIFKRHQSERARITVNGLTFNGDTAEANALDDYEEGTWTPSVVGSNLSTAPNASEGRYTKIGRQVTASFKITGWAANIGERYIVFEGLPYVQHANSTDEQGYCNAYPYSSRRMGFIINNSSGNNTQWYSAFEITSTVSSGGSLRGTIIYTTT